MGVSTTRALSLVVSGEETIDRPWYDTSEKRPVANEEFLLQVAPQFADAPPELKQMALAQLKSQLRNPNKLQTEPCAITCRVARSFLRVGQIELFGRRARKGGKSEREELELIIQHVLQREYADVDDPTAPLEKRVLRMIHEFSQRLSKLMSDWLRVGYCQGNFNSDNCLVAGRTMDYGPFGFIEKYDPLWNMWTGGGEHFAFMNQPKAAQKNFLSFVRAVAPLLDDTAVNEAQAAVNKFPEVCAQVCGDMWRRKLGLKAWDGEAEGLFEKLKDLMAQSSVDYTIFWRQLAELPDRGLVHSTATQELFQPIQQAFYSELSGSLKQKWTDWLQQWLNKLEADGHAKEAASLIRQTSPKYVPREWMLVEAYEAAMFKSDYSIVESLNKLFSNPFDEQPEFEQRYYRKVPSSVEEKPGTCFMS